MNGEIQDALFYGLLRREWEDQRRQAPLPDLFNVQSSAFRLLFWAAS